VMELLEGETLAERLRRVGRVEVPAAVAIAVQVADALAAAHAAGVVHRDLKPDNLFLVRRGGHEQVKVLDFGVAKLIDPVGDAASVKTRTGVVIGTPLYMSPELCAGNRAVDHRTDVYALGIILYEMLCGEPPFTSTGFGELAHMHLAVPPRSLRGRSARVPEGLERVVLTALAKQPADRFTTMAELRDALAPWTNAATGTRRPRSLRWLALTVGFTLAAGVAALAVTRARPRAPQPSAAAPKPPPPPALEPPLPAGEPPLPHVESPPLPAESVRSPPAARPRPIKRAPKTPPSAPPPRREPIPL